MSSSHITKPLWFAFQFLMAAGQGVTQEGIRSKMVDGVAIQYGILSAAAVARAHPPNHAEGRMHGGPPSGRDDYHLDIALFEVATGKRISDAQVSATVSELGLAGKWKKLEPEHLADAVSFGNYFTMRGDGPFRIVVEARLPGSAKPVVVQFDHRVR